MEVSHDIHSETTVVTGNRTDYATSEVGNGTTTSTSDKNNNNGTNTNGYATAPSEIALDDTGNSLGTDMNAINSGSGSDTGSTSVVPDGTGTGTDETARTDSIPTSTTPSPQPQTPTPIPTPTQHHTNTQLTSLPPSQPQPQLQPSPTTDLSSSPPPPPHPDFTSPPPPIVDLDLDALDAPPPIDPPPPYPSGSGRRRSGRSRTGGEGRRVERDGTVVEGRRWERGGERDDHTSSFDSREDGDGDGGAGSMRGGQSMDSSPRIASRHHGLSRHGHPHAHTNPHHTQRHARPRSISHASIISAAPSFSQTVRSLFNTDDEVYLSGDDEISGVGGSRAVYRDREGDEGEDGDDGESRHLLSIISAEDVDEGWLEDGTGDPITRRNSTQNLRISKASWRSKHWWKRYFKPISSMSYYRPLFHLLILNFPFALVAWVYLFVFTVTGTTLLVALPIGAALCFLNLIGARVFARAELAMQSRYHPSLLLPAPYPPRPVFTRWREVALREVEGRNGGVVGDVDGDGDIESTARHGMMKERSFYKNAYAMFTDSTSYQALFYFLVIKPGITLFITLFLVVVGIPGMVLVVPAPAVLRAVRRVGVWQAGVAIEGLWVAVR